MREFIFWSLFMVSIPLLILIVILHMLNIIDTNLAYLLGFTDFIVMCTGYLGMGGFGYL